MSLMRGTEFGDRHHWDRLAQKYLSAYHMPRWSQPCTVEAMTPWFYRLDIKIADYEKACGIKFKLATFAELTRWPLRAWLGTLLEMRDELTSAAAVGGDVDPNGRRCR